MTVNPIIDKVKCSSSPTAKGSTKHAVRFADLASAGRDLAGLLDNYLGNEDTVVVAIARGGVPVALEVANHLGAPLDLILIRRLLAPNGPGSQICAVNVCGTLVVDEELVLRPPAPKTPLDYFIAEALEALAFREQLCRGGRPAFEVARRNVILVDNGVHTGSTVLAAIRALRTLKPSRLVVAVPAAALSSRAVVMAAADDVVCLAWPEPFGHVGLWYADFNVPDEKQIRKMLDQVRSGS